MTEKQTTSSKNENVEFLLTELTDETPPSSSEESLCDKRGGPVCQEQEEKQNSNGRQSAEILEEGLCKFEKEATNTILAIKSEVETLKEKILTLGKEELQRDYKIYEEILISKTLSLDRIETQGLEKIKQIRKNAILLVQDTLNILDLNRK